MRRMLLGSEMNFLFVITLLVTSVASAPGLLGLPLDIGSLLSSLRPAPPNDPRFTNFSPPGPTDGKLRVSKKFLKFLLMTLKLDHPVLGSMVRTTIHNSNLEYLLIGYFFREALSNHGFINHNGRDMTIPHLVKGLSEGLNVGADFTVALGGAALKASPDPLSGSFDLDDLISIEHDASLSRQDAATGNARPFYSPSWQQYMSFFHGKTTTDIPTAAEAKFARYNDSLTNNREFVYGAREAVLSYGETALYLQTMADPVSGKAKISYIRSLFEQETLPYALGWRPSAAPINLASVGTMIVRLLVASPDPILEDTTIIT
jgi:hypothetical protein